MGRPTGRLRVLAGAVASAAACLALPLSASGAGTGQAATSLPRVPAYLGVGAKYMEIRPRYILYTGDSSGVLSGPKPGSSLHWTSWSAQTAFGGGYNQIDNCKPDCASGHFIAYPIKLEAWKPGMSHGELVFSRLTILYTGKRPAGVAAHYTFTTTYSSTGWGLGPPGAEGYCTHTDGQPKAPGCANITALPPGLAS
jgi:hypothetical protein